jgi:hypothetical protein
MLYHIKQEIISRYPSFNLVRSVLSLLLWTALYWALKNENSVFRMEQSNCSVFDVSRLILLAETKAGRIISESRETLVDTIAEQKATHLAELDVGILVCGAVSRPLQEMISTYGIRVIPFLVRRHVRSH